MSFVIWKDFIEKWFISLIVLDAHEHGGVLVRISWRTSDDSRYGLLNWVLLSGARGQRDTDVP